MLLQQVLIEVMCPFRTHHCVAVKCREGDYGDSMRARPRNTWRRSCLLSDGWRAPPPFTGWRREVSPRPVDLTEPELTPPANNANMAKSASTTAAAVAPISDQRAQ